MDACDPHNDFPGPTVTPAEQPSQTFTITETRSFSIEANDIDPEYCEARVEYVYEEDPDNPINQGEGGSPITFNPEDGTFTFDYDDFTDLAGDDPNGTNYTITYKKIVGDKVVEETIEITIKNPCLDPDFLTIEAATLPNFTYILHDESEEGTTFVHPPFTVVAEDSVREICGDLEYSLTEGLNGGALDPYLTYTPEERKVMIYSEDRDLLENSPYEYEIVASLKEYPSRS